MANLRPPIALLDRRVRILSDDQPELSCVGRLSELRSSPFVVLLGEPGIGKSTVLSQEAACENATVRTVRDLMTDIEPLSSAPLFIDALDEYRIDGGPIDKAHGLGRAMRQAQVSRWRLTCRAEDWRKSADLAAISSSAGGRSIVVAQLLPLSYAESAEVLNSLGATNPDGFLKKAYGLGAQSLLESPLSLKLLYAAVSHGGTWPTTRHDLFAAAIESLAHEHNEMHRGGPRLPVSRIIEAAEKTCLVLLLSGRRAIWRSHAETPAAGRDERAYLRGYELELDNALLRDMLDTTLFRGEGESFEPMHRTVAEYVAGRALAKAVNGDARNAAMPLSRAIAMATGVDMKAPAELRGLYAWFAAHLAKSGRDDGARQLIEADAATVLAYGDAAVLSTPLRRAVFINLDRDDPFFRAGDHEHYPAVGGFAGPDLAKDFAQILDKGSDGSHRLVTVFEALTTGSPMESMRPRLWSIALDPRRPEWERRRAGDVWLNGAQHRARELYDAISATPASEDRESLRVHIAAQLPAGSFSAEDIKSLIADFARTKRTHWIGSLISLAHNLAGVPHGELFDVHVKTWLPEGALQIHSVALDHFFDSLLAATIRETTNLRAAQVWRWANNAREGRADHLHEQSVKALQAWFDADSTREAALIDVIIDDDEDRRDAPWTPGNDITILTWRLIAAPSVRHILAISMRMPVDSASRARLAVAIEMTRRLKDEQAAVLQEMSAALSTRADCADLAIRLTARQRDLPNQELVAAEAARRAKDAETRAQNVELFAPEIESIRAGHKLKWLAWAARLYLRKEKEERLVGIDLVTYYSSEEIKDAVLAGWHRVLTHHPPPVDAKLLGQSLNVRATDFELSVYAGLSHLLLRGPVPDSTAISAVVAIAILKAAEWLHPSSHRKFLECWALDRLNAESVSGARHLCDFWVAAIDAGAIYIESFGRVREDDAHGPAVIEALYLLLDARRSMPAKLLRSALRAAVKRIELKRLLPLAEAIIGDAAVSWEQRQIWTFLAFMLDPRKYGQQMLAQHGLYGGAAQLYEDFRSHEYEPISTIDLTARAEREAVIVRLVGPSHPPENDEHLSREDRLSNADVVHRAIQMLPNYPEVETGIALQGLIEDPALASWKRDLQHAHAQWARIHRESIFHFPTPKAVVDALSGGPPLNAADLKAVVMEELHRLRRELRTSDNTPWKRYWNTGRNGEVEKPRVENECRDHLLDRLRDRLERYKITAALPESRRQEQTRTDILVLSAIGRTLPVEIKRHYHDDLWTAASTQLNAYTLAEESDGYGIYLVFWFGIEDHKPVTRADKATPASAAELETMLRADLGAQLRERISVIVFDVSKGDAAAKI